LLANQFQWFSHILCYFSKTTLRWKSHNHVELFAQSFGTQHCYLHMYIGYLAGFCFPHQHNDAIKTNMFFRVLAVSFLCQPFVKIFIENGDNLRQTIAGQTKSCTHLAPTHFTLHIYGFLFAFRCVYFPSLGKWKNHCIYRSNLIMISVH